MKSPHNYICAMMYSLLRFKRSINYTPLINTANYVANLNAK